MDRRRVNLNWKPRQQKENSNSLLISLFTYFFLSLFIGSLIFALKSLVISMIIIHTYILFMMSMMLITDFSNVLLDTTDNQIILPKPVNNKTLFVARLVHILTYLLQFTIALATIPIIFIFIEFGITTGLSSIITILLIVAFAVFFTYLLYILILRFSNEQKVKDIIGYFQIFMTIFFAIGFQIIPRLINFNNIALTFHLHWYSYLLPPVWMALSIEAINQLNFNSLHLLMIALAFLIPLFTFWVMLRYLAPSFAKKLAVINNDNLSVKNELKVSIVNSVSKIIADKICSSKTENASFETTWKITSRDKGFKLQFYPGLAYIVVFIFIFVFKSGKNVATIWQNLPSTKMFLPFIYMPILSISTGMIFISIHENYMASWIFQSTPIQKPGFLISGGLKALFIKFFVLIYLLMFLFSFYVWGFSIVDDFVLGFFNNMLIILLMANLSDHYLPFSRQPNIKQQSGRLVQVILQLIIIGALIGLHYFILKFTWIIYCLIPIVIIGCYFLLKRIQNLKWGQISF